MTDSAMSPVPTVELAQPTAAGSEVVTGTGPQVSVQMSRALFERSPAAVMFARHAEGGYSLTDAQFGPAASAAAGLHIPLLVIGPGGEGVAEIAAELERLGVETIVGYGDPAADWAGLLGSRDMLAGPTDAYGFESVLGLEVTEEPVQAPDVVAAVSGLEGNNPRLIHISSDTADPAVAETPAGSASAQPTASDAGTGLAGLATMTQLPEFQPAGQAAPALVLATSASEPASLATARAAGANIEIVTDADPRSTPAAVEAVRSHAGSPILAVGEAFGTQAGFAAHTAVAATGVQLPGGGQTVFPGRRMVALYGHPSGPALGALGEQEIEETIARVKGLAAQYQPFSDEPVIPALDLIATIASAEPGADGDYSTETTVEDLRPWIDAAEKEGVYVVLDLQSGRSDFLSQAKLYEEFLARPFVGLALDPEWRLAPGQQPLEQIGTVGAAEINAVSTWLADLTRDRNLPQKLLMVHQFRIDMINDRAEFDTSRTELAITLHSDGHGTPDQKLETWAALQSVPPEGIWPSWKNFYDEDQPMLTPEQTYTIVDPKPWLVTYQ